MRGVYDATMQTVDGVQLTFLPPTKAVNERGELMQYFLDTLNRSRSGTKWRPLRMGFIAKRLQGVPTNDLYSLKSKMLHDTTAKLTDSMIFYIETDPKYWNRRSILR